MKLGTYSTIDAPTKKLEEAGLYLKKEFGKIGGKVRIVMNDHDLGAYPSFEIDYPWEVEEKKIDLEVEDEDTDLENAQDIVDEWHAKARGIEARYSEKFNQYL